MRVSALPETRSRLVPLDLVRAAVARQRAPTKAAYGSHLASEGQESALNGDGRKPASRPSSVAHTQLGGSQRDKASCLLPVIFGQYVAFYSCLQPPEPPYGCRILGSE